MIVLCCFVCFLSKWSFQIALGIWDVLLDICTDIGVEVKAGQPLKVKPDDEEMIHVSQVSIITYMV